VALHGGNVASLASVASCGFSREGYSPRYLKIRERWAACDRCQPNGGAAESAAQGARSRIKPASKLDQRIFRVRHGVNMPFLRPAQRVGRPQPRAEAEGRCPGKKGVPNRCGLKGRENPTRQDSSRGPSGRSALSSLHPGHRPSASALGSILPARWAGREPNALGLSSGELVHLFCDEPSAPPDPGERQPPHSIAPPPPATF
jgi:hypothetical protein